jgi:hypothetical protein
MFRGMHVAAVRARIVHTRNDSVTGTRDCDVAFQCDFVIVAGSGPGVTGV